MTVLQSSTDQARIVAAAREWIGTPYHHQASLKGVGCDCLGLVRGIWRQIYGAEPQAVPAYSPDWGEAGTVETLLNAGRAHFEEVPLETAEQGHVICFRVRATAIAKHLGILSGEGRMIHAQEGVGVVEVLYAGWWQRRAVAAFGFPD